MNAKEFLRQYLLLKYEVERLDGEIKIIREEMQGKIDVVLHSPWPDGQPHGASVTDPVGEQAARHADKMRRKYEELQNKLMDYETKRLRAKDDSYNAMIEISDVIGKVQNVKCRQLLEMRYIHGKRWEEIAVEMDLSYQWVAGPLKKKSERYVEKIIKSSNS